jgi:hypothetical protein
MTSRRGLTLLLGAGLAACGRAAAPQHTPAPEAGPPPAVSLTWQDGGYPLVRFGFERLPAIAADGSLVAYGDQGIIGQSDDVWAELVAMSPAGAPVKSIRLVDAADWTRAGSQPRAAQPAIDARIRDVNAWLGERRWLVLVPAADVSYAEPRLTWAGATREVRAWSIPRGGCNCGDRDPACEHPASLVGAWTDPTGRTALVHLGYAGDIEGPCNKPADRWFTLQR